MQFFSERDLIEYIRNSSAAYLITINVVRISRLVFGLNMGYQSNDKAA